MNRRDRERLTTALRQGQFEAREAALRCFEAGDKEAAQMFAMLAVGDRLMEYGGGRNVAEILAYGARS